jgi:hypothetical protein
MKENEKEFIQKMQRRIANVAIGGSALHGAPKHTVKTIRKFLTGSSQKGGLKIDPLIRADSEKKYIRALDTATTDLRKFVYKKIRKRRPWGSARKCLNIFIRDFFYNQYLNKHYQLKNNPDLESWLEVPLDRFVAKGLNADWKELKRNNPESPNLKAVSKEIILRWPGVEKLKETGQEKTGSKEYQSIAREIARFKYKTDRVHLDLYYWRPETDQKAKTKS